MVLSAPGVSGFAWADDGSWDEINAAQSAGDARGAALAWLRHGYMAPSMRIDHLRPGLQTLALANAQVWTREQSEVPLDPPAIGRLQEVLSRTLLLVGDEDVPDIHKIAARLSSDLPNVERVDLIGGHLLSLEQPERFNELVLGFLRPL